MTSGLSRGIIRVTKPVRTVAHMKEDAEMQRATDKLTALYCRLSQEDANEGESYSIQNQDEICQGYFHLEFSFIAKIEIAGSQCHFEWTQTPRYFFSAPIFETQIYIRILRCRYCKIIYLLTAFQPVSIRNLIFTGK